MNLIQYYTNYTLERTKTVLRACRILKNKMAWIHQFRELRSRDSISKTWEGMDIPYLRGSGLTDLLVGLPIPVDIIKHVLLDFIVDSCYKPKFGPENRPSWYRSYNIVYGDVDLVYMDIYPVYYPRRLTMGQIMEASMIPNNAKKHRVNDIIEPKNVQLPKAPKPLRMKPTKMFNSQRFKNSHR